MDSTLTKETIVTYLEMHAPPQRTRQCPVPPDTLVMQAVQPTASFYRYLYNTVGETWDWHERRRMSDDELCAIVQHPEVSVFVAYVGGVPAGYAELDARQLPDIELAYFGLLPEFIGKGLGGFLLDWAVDQAWSFQPHRLWVHTCTLDHPNALAVYQRAGFVSYKQEREHVQLT